MALKKYVHLWTEKNPRLTSEEAAGLFAREYFEEPRLVDLTSMMRTWSHDGVFRGTFSLVGDDAIYLLTCDCGGCWDVCRIDNPEGY
jgi:hypothetical protein